MLIHHVTNLHGKSQIASEILSHCQRKKSFLVAADYLRYENRKSINRSHVLRACSHHLILDSGVLGAAKKGHSEWMIEGVGKVVEFGIKIEADRVAHVDIPSEPHILDMLDLTVSEARDITVDNAYRCLEFEELNGRRVISVQGWTLEDRQRCLELLYPVIERDKDAWIGNGSTCMLTPRTGLYKFYEWICSELPDRHIHAWGIANPKWLVNLHRIGVASADSGTAVFANGMNESIDPITGRRSKNDWGGKRDSFMAALGFIRNMEAIEQSFQKISEGNVGLYLDNGQSKQVSFL